MALLAASGEYNVGCTRAMRRLLVTYDRGLPSPFLAHLSKDRWAAIG
ncbi:MAG TPA: hypothetical protein PKJ56_02570 [Promineifilum sp.]|nr:hypothetical protein [Promineifilum sp.]